MSQYNVAILGLALLSGLTSIIGVILALRLGARRESVALGMGFSVGIMLLISCVELLPTAVQLAGLVETTLTCLAGMAVLALLNYLIPHTHLFNEADNPFGISTLKTAYLVAFGLILHDFPEGFAMANSYITAPRLGVLVAISIALHNIPEEFAMALPFVSLKKKRYLYTAAIISALSEPLGAILGLGAVQLAPQLNPLFLAFAAGAMIFVSLHELVPMARTYQQPLKFGVGMGVSVLTYLFLGLVLPEHI